MKKTKARNEAGLAELGNPNEIHGISYDYRCNAEIVEKALAGLPMKAARHINYSTFTKLSDRPFGHSRYNVYDTIDSFLGYIEIEKIIDSAAIVTFVCPMKFEGIFQKIKSALDRQIASDLEISRIAVIEHKPSKPQSQEPMAEASNALLPPIEDPTDLRMWEIIKKDPSIIDVALGQKMGNLGRQAVNRRRKGLEKMGYQVREVSRQKS